MSLLPSEREWARYSQSSRVYRDLREPGRIVLGWSFAAVHLAPRVPEVTFYADAVGPGVRAGRGASGQIHSAIVLQKFHHPMGIWTRRHRGLLTKRKSHECGT